MKLPLFLLTSLLFLFNLSKSCLAIYDPLTVPNNRVGIHLLSPEEIETAAKLINNNNQGSWGYVTVPIQATDRNRSKWLHFMKKAKELKVIPIIRIATFAQGPNWAQPNNYDLTDFANFLNDLPWPTQNRYIIVFNEVNRRDEYGGFLKPSHYSDILSNAINIFKARSDKFFILPAGLDNAAANSQNSLKWSTYLHQMYQHNPHIFTQIDGWTSHAYPNPAFSSHPASSGENKINSFITDLQFLRQFTSKPLPIFITETGWTNKTFDQKTIADFFNYAFTNVWSNPQIVTVTPFLLQAGTPPFNQFSLLDHNHQPLPVYFSLQNHASSGQPLLEAASTPPLIAQKILGRHTSPPPPELTSKYSSLNLQSVKKLFQLIFNFFNSSPFTHSLKVGDKEYQVEIAASPKSQQIGLAKHSSLPSNSGMLFQFKEPALHTIWMKNMQFNIDIVWISNYQVIGISQGNHQTPEKIITPPAPVDQVLEVNPNSNIQVGDKITLNG